MAQLRNTSTVNVTLAALNSYFTWHGWEETTVDSVTRLRRVLPPLAAVERSRCLDEAALRRPRDYALFVMGLATGLRESELAALEVDDVVLQAHSGSVRAPGPDDVERVVPLTESARRVQLTWFADWQRLLGSRQRRGFFLRDGLDRPLSARRVDEIVRSIGQAAGVRNLSPGVLRNTFEQDLRDQGLDEQEIACLMGRAQPDPARARALRGSSTAPLSAATGTGRQRRARRLPAVAGEQLRMEF